MVEEDVRPGVYSMTGADWYALHLEESEACGYIVTVGHTYCRTCGGAGGVPYEDGPCDVCNGVGEFPHEDWNGEVEYA